MSPPSTTDCAPIRAWRPNKSANGPRALGLPHDILLWRGEKPASGVQERAREARYALLFAHARALGAQAVVTAHHRDDQWETILIRLARGSGLAGLAGMARDQLFPQGRVLRPLLGLPKQALVDFCRREGQDFFEDPANANPAFERARWRAAAPALACARPDAGTPGKSWPSAPARRTRRSTMRRKI